MSSATAAGSPAAGARLEPTYEGLKFHGRTPFQFTGRPRLEPTYEGLK